MNRVLLNILIITILSLFFNFKLLTFYYSTWLGVSAFIGFFVAIWKIFINNNFFYYRIKPMSTDRLNKTNPFKKLKYTIFLKWMLSITFLFILCLSCFRYTSFFFFWNHLVLTNARYNIIYFLVIVGFLLMLYLKFFSASRQPASIDFFFAVANLTAAIPLLYMVNTLYSFIFFVEFISTIIFYKFVVSKVWCKEFDEQIGEKGKDFNRSLPNQYLDMLFFQFWATFFSTVLLLTSILTLFFIFNTSDWVSMYYLINLGNNRGYFNSSIFYTFLFIPMFFGIFLKLGLSPLHLYKIEVYQGIPFKTIFFYTTYFFLSFTVFFCFMLIFLFQSAGIYWNWFLTLFFVLGVFYTLSLLFDVQYIKAFFAYSTIVNVIFSILIVVLFINFG